MGGVKSFGLSGALTGLDSTGRGRIFRDPVLALVLAVNEYSFERSCKDAGGLGLGSAPYEPS
jgi:hypothetical protein